MSLYKHKIAGKYIFSGLFKTAVHTISGFIILRWLNPSELGAWQSFTVFTSYIGILTLGTTSGLNRDLPYYMGKGENEAAINKLKAGGYFTTALSLGLFSLVMVCSLFIYVFGWFNVESTIFFFLAFSMAALNIQTEFLGATFRSANSFSKLTIIQLFNSILYVVLIPLIYLFNIWGYIAYQILLALFLYIGYWMYRPFKVKYTYNLKETIELVKVGMPMFFWNYLTQISRAIPRTILVVFGTPLIVGLYSPAGSINAAMLNLPSYTNRYLFPKMSYLYGKTNNIKELYTYSIKAARVLFSIMLLAAIILAFIIPPIFNNFFPKYVAGIIPAQITIFSGVFYSINSLLHNTLNSLKIFKPFKIIISLRILYIITFTMIAWLIFKELMLSVAIGAVMSELFNIFNYVYFLKKELKS